MEDTEEEKPFGELGPANNAKVGTAMGVAMIALNMAMRYHDTNVVKDGALYQQYKLEGKNLQPLCLDMVFETAMQIELHLLAGERRISQLVAEALVDGFRRDSDVADDSDETHDMEDDK